MLGFAFQTFKAMGRAAINAAFEAALDAGSRKKSCARKDCSCGR